MKTKTSSLIVVLLIVSVSCTTNQNYENRIKKLEAKIIELDSSLTSILKENQQQKKVPGKNKKASQLQKIKSNLSVERKFVGTWIYYKSIPAAQDNSLSGITLTLERYANTNETFVAHIFSGHDLILSVKNENTLVGQNANMSVKYDANTDNLSLVISSGTTQVYSRLK